MQQKKRKPQKDIGYLIRNVLRYWVNDENIFTPQMLKNTSQKDLEYLINPHLKECLYNRLGLSRGADTIKKFQKTISRQNKKNNRQRVKKIQQKQLVKS